MGSGSSVESHLLPLQLVEVSIQYEEANQLFCMKYDDDDNRELSLFGQLVLLSFGHPDELNLCVLVSECFELGFSADVVVCVRSFFVPKLSCRQQTSLGMQRGVLPRPQLIFSCS